MRHIHSSLWLENRLLSFASNEHVQRVESIFESVTTHNDRPVSSDNVGLEVERLHTLATTEVKNVKPSAGKKLKQMILGAFVKDGSVYDANTSEVENAIDRQAFQRMQIAEKQLDGHEHHALRNIRSLTRKTKLSACFLKHKIEICDGVKRDLEKEVKVCNDRLKGAKDLRSFDRAQLQTAVKSMGDKIELIGRIVEDSSEKIAHESMVGTMHYNIDSAVKYFSETCSAYLPEYASDVRTMIKKYIEGDKSKLENLIQKLARTMHPRDTKNQKGQVAAMKRIAEKITGNQGVWRAIRRRFVDIAPTLAVGVAAGVMTGGVGWGVALASGVGGIGTLARGLHNKVRYGTASQREFEKAQAAGYFNSIALDNVERVNAVKKLPELKERLAAIADMKKFPSGSRIIVDADGENIELTLSRVSNGARLATASKTGELYSLDTEGVDGTYLVVQKTSDGPNDVGQLDISNASNDSVFSLKPYTPPVGTSPTATK